MDLRKAAAIGTLALFGACATASAQQAVVKTWISSTGADTGSCDISVPCASLQYAFNQTAAGGEVEVRDSGNYGPLSINHAVSIISSAAGATLSDYGIDLSGIYVAAGTSDTVTIRGLTINGHNSFNTIGIVVVSGKAVIIDHCNIVGADVGIDLNSGSSYVMITNNVITQNGQGITPNTTPYVFLGGNVIAGNGIGISGGTIYTYGDNDINTNSTVDERMVTSHAVNKY